MIILYAVPISISGLCWAKKIGIFILGTLTIMTVNNDEICTTFIFLTIH